MVPGNGILSYWLHSFSTTSSCLPGADTGMNYVMTDCWSVDLWLRLKIMRVTSHLLNYCLLLPEWGGGVPTGRQGDSWSVDLDHGHHTTDPPATLGRVSESAGHEDSLSKISLIFYTLARGVATTGSLDAGFALPASI